jgi:hypothetical protein
MLRVNFTFLSSFFNVKVDELMASLNEKGIRESALKRSLQRHYEQILTTMRRRQQVIRETMERRDYLSS